MAGLDRILFKNPKTHFNNRARLLVRNVPGLNEMWSNNFGKGQAVLVFLKLKGYVEESRMSRYLV